VKVFLNDCRHALRLYIRTPSSSLIAVSVLAVGMAFVGSFLSLYVDLVLRPHPGFEQSRQIATIGQNTGTDLTGITYEAVARIADEMTSIEAAAMFTSATLLIGADGEQVVAALVSEEFFSGLRPRLALGRGTTLEEHAPDAEPVVVLSHRLWQDRFNGDPGVLGRFLEVWRPRNSLRQTAGNRIQDDPDDEDSAAFRIIGVMADSLPNLVPTSGGVVYDPAIWLPLERAWPLLGNDPASLRRASTNGTLVRRAPGVPVSAVANELRARFGDEPGLWNGRAGTMLDAIDGIVGNSVVQLESKRQLEMFLAGSVLLALVAAANVSLFLLARAPGRRRELGIRLAVGAPIGRLARQLATEAGLLVVVATALGLVGSIWLSLYLRGLAFLRQAEWREVTLLDWRVLALATAILVILTLLVSLAPILGLKRLGIATASRQVAARASLAQRVAGTTQIAVAGLLGGAAIAFGWYLGALIFGYPGYTTTNRYLLQGFSQSGGSAEARTVESRRWRDAVETIPGVTRVAFGSPVPGAEANPSPRRIPDPKDSNSEIEIYTGFLERPFIDLLGLNLLYGRAPELGATDVVVVNRALARAVWGRDNVVGERMTEGPVRGEVIGVLADVSYGHPLAAVKPYIFSAEGGGVASGAVIEAQLSAAELQQAITEIQSDEFQFFLFGFRPLGSLRENLIAPERARGFLTIVTASLVVLLAALGFYGTQRYLVAAGRREYAIRASLGAGPRALGRLVVWRGLLLGLPGLVAGAFLAFIIVAWLRDDYVSREISAVGVTVWVVIGLIGLLLAASLGPARAARHTRPAPLLRED
jgi:hypothetical protein